MEFQAEPQHQAFPGMVNGGIIGTLLDCHGNWTAAVALMDEQGLEEPPCTVTASYEVKLRRPTPVSSLLTVTSEVVELLEDRCPGVFQQVGRFPFTGSGRADPEVEHGFVTVPVHPPALVAFGDVGQLVRRFEPEFSPNVKLPCFIDHRAGAAGAGDADDFVPREVIQLG